MLEAQFLRELGEKSVIAQIIKPLLNPDGDLNSIGDDCAVVEAGGGVLVCASTDRVPADLVSYKLGIIDRCGLGYYLAILNLSDIAAMGAEPVGLLLNLALPPDTRIEDFRALLSGAKAACDLHGTSVIGGDLSSANEMSLSATSLGLARHDKVLRRVGALAGDLVYCCGFLGLTPSAFAYFLQARPRGMTLDAVSEDLLKDQFRNPQARFDVARRLIAEAATVTAMDNTDGAGQTLLELAELNKLAIVLDPDVLPIHPITLSVAAFLGQDPLDLALGPGADFQLLGTIGASSEARDAAARCGVTVIGEARRGHGVARLLQDGNAEPLTVTGWNYYSPIEDNLVGQDNQPTATA